MKVEAPKKHRLTFRQRMEGRWIAKLKRLNCYHQVVKRLLDGQSVWSVTQWLVGLKVEGDLGKLRPETLRQYVTALSIRLKNRAIGIERKPIASLAFQGLLEQLEHEAQAKVDDLPLTAEGKTQWPEVERAIEELDSEKMLKLAFLIQKGRVEMMLAVEEKLGFLVPEGHKNIAVLKEIGNSVRKLEIGARLMRRESPEPRRRAKPKLTGLAAELRKLDLVDGNSTVDATEYTPEMIVEEAIRFRR